MVIENARHRIADRWRQISVGSVNRRIFGAAATVSGATLAVAVALTARELFVAASFGTSDAVDAFLIALVLPKFIVHIISTSFNAVLVPAYVQVREDDGRAAAQRLFSGFMAWALVLLVIVSIILALVGPLLLPLLASGFEREKLLLTRDLLLVLLPTVILSAPAAICTSLLQAEERFALAALTPAITHVVAIGALLAFSSSWGIFALAIGTLTGSILEVCFLMWGVRRHNLSVWPRWYNNAAAIRQVAGQYVPNVIGVVLLGSTTLVDQAMAATLAPGSVAALGYGNKVVVLILVLGGVAIKTAVLPFYSKMVVDRNWTGVRHTVKTFTMLSLIASVPITILLFVFSTPVVRILFERGAFSHDDTYLIGQVQAMYALQIPAFVLICIIAPLISSLRANHLLMWSAVISLPLNIALDYVLIQYLGVAGIALSTTLIYVVSWIYLGVSSYRIIRKHELG